MSKEVNAFNCTVERIKCPLTGKYSLKLTGARPLSRLSLTLRRAFRAVAGYRNPADVPVSDVVFAVDAEKSALVAMLQPWRKCADVSGGVRLSFFDEPAPANRRESEAVKL